MVLILSVDVILKIFGYRLNRFVYKQKIKPFSRFLLFQPFLLFSLSPFSRLLLYLPTSFACCCLSKQNPQIVDTTSAANPQNPQSPAHPQTLRVRCTHNLKSEALLLIQSTRRHRSLAYSLPIHIQISGALISNPTRQHFISSRTTRQHFFYSILNRWRHPQSSGSLFTYD